MPDDLQAVKETPDRFNASPSGTTSPNIMSRAWSERGSLTDVTLGARAHNPPSTGRAHAPPTQSQFNPDNPGPPTPYEGPLHE